MILKQKILLYGIIAGLIFPFLHQLFYHNKWDIILASGIPLHIGFWVTILATMMSAIFHYRRAAPLGDADFLRLFALCMSITVLGGLLASIYDIVFYAWVEPGYDLRIATAHKEAFEQIMNENPEVKEKMQDALKGFEENIKNAREKGPASPFILITFKLAIYLFWGSFSSLILSFLLRDRIVDNSPPKSS